MNPKPGERWLVQGDTVTILSIQDMSVWCQRNDGTKFHCDLFDFIVWETCRRVT